MAHVQLPQHLSFEVQCEGPNLSVLSAVCLAFPEYSGVESGNETEPVTMASAGCWTPRPTSTLPHLHPALPLVH